MKKFFILATSLIASQAFAYSQSEIAGTWECMSPGQTYTMMLGADGGYESHQGDGSNYVGSYSIEENYLNINLQNTNYQSASPSNGYTVTSLTNNQMVLEADGEMISCNK